MRCRPFATPGFRPVAPALVLLFALSAPAPAQIQPIEASNAQDEYVTINKEVEADTSQFAILRSGNKQEINKYVTKTYVLQNAAPFEVFPYLNSIAQLERGSVITASMTPPGRGGGNWIQVNVPEFQVPFIDDLVAAYDVPGFIALSGSVKFSYRLRHRRASDVADFLRTSALSGTGTIRADDGTNTVFIQDTPSQFERLFAHLQFYDIPVPQVAIELKIVELNELDAGRLGLDWDAWKTSIAGDLTGAYRSVRDRILAEPEIGGRSRTFDGLISLDATVLARFLNYLESEGKAHTIISTVINVSNGETGLLQSGTDVPTFQYIRLNGFQTLTRVDAPTKPPIPSGEGIAVAVNPIVSITTTRLDCEVVLRGPAGIDALGAPIFSEQRLLSNLSVDQGNTYTVGSLRRRTHVKDRKGIPLLKSIPLIRYLFSVETTIARDTELFVFASPTWTAPLIPTETAFQGMSTMVPVRLENFLRANPSLGVGPEDQRVLETYFTQRAAAEMVGAQQ